MNKIGGFELQNHDYSPVGVDIQLKYKDFIIHLEAVEDSKGVHTSMFFYNHVFGGQYSTSCKSFDEAIEWVNNRCNRKND